MTTRGTGADVIIIDEAAHIDPALFFKTIVPILSMKKTSLMCLSSPEGDSNYYSALMELKKDNGESFFNVVNCFQICDRCLKLERTKQILCNHVKNTSHWLDQRKIRELKLLYKASPEDAIREFGGVVVSDHLPCFRKEEVLQAFKLKRVPTLAMPPYVFVACDPNGGGPSHLSIVSGYHNKLGDIVLVGMESEPVRDDYEVYLLVRRHIEKLLERDHLKNSRIVFIPENNMGLESAHLDTMVRDIPQVETFWETERRPGVCKTAAVTRQYQFLMNNALSQKSMRIDQDLFTVTRERCPEDMLSMLQDQLLRYHWERKKAVDNFGRDRYTITGKIGNAQDDLLISTMMVIYWGRVISRDPRRLEGGPATGATRRAAGFDMMSMTVGRDRRA